MRFFGLEITRGERRSAGLNPLDDRFYIPFDWNKQTAAGMNVNPETAQKFCTIYTCVKIIAETLGSVPLVLYRRGKGDSRDRATEHPLYRVLRSRPNKRQTAIEWREFMTASYLLTGDAYSEIIANGAGDIEQLIPISPYIVEPERKGDGSGEVIYKVKNPDGTFRRVAQDRMFHIKIHSPDGVKGRSPISYFAELIGLGMELDNFESRFYANNASPAGIIQMGEDQDLSDKAKERLRNDWKKKYGKSGIEQNGIAILEEGMEWKQIGIAASDAQLLESKKLTDRRLCGCYRVPPYMVGDLEKGGLANVEQMSLDFTRFTMLSHFTRWEEAVDTRLLGWENRSSEKYYAEFMIDNLQRADILARFRSYAIARQWGWLSTNDIRSRENMNPVDGGDVYLQPMNMIDAEDADKLLDDGNGTVDPSGKGGKGKKKPAGTKNELDDNSNPQLKNSLEEFDARSKEIRDLLFDTKNLIKEVQSHKNQLETPQKEEKSAENGVIELKAPSFARVRESAVEAFSRTLSRLMRKEILWLKSARKKNPMGDFTRSFYPDHFKLVAGEMRPIITSYCEHTRFLCSFMKRDFIGEDAVPAGIDKMIDELTRRYDEVYRDGDENRTEESAQSLARELVSIIETHTTSAKIIAELPARAEPPAPPPPAPTTNVVVQVELPKEEKESPALGLEPYTREDGTRAYRILREKPKEGKSEK